MTATKRLVLDLPVDQVNAIESRVASGDYASPSALVAARLGQGVAPLAADDSSPEWLGFSESCRETLRRVDAGEEPTFTTAEVRAYLAEQRAGRSKPVR